MSAAGEAQYPLNGPAMKRSTLQNRSTIKAQDSESFSTIPQTSDPKLYPAKAPVRVGLELRRPFHVFRKPPPLLVGNRSGAPGWNPRRSDDDLFVRRIAPPRSVRALVQIATIIPPRPCARPHATRQTNAGFKIPGLKKAGRAMH